MRVFNELGEVRCRARAEPAMRPGVVFLPKGLWAHNTESGTTANALAPDTLTDLGGRRLLQRRARRGRAGAHGA